MIRVRNWKERLYGAGLISTLFTASALWTVRAELVPPSPLAITLTLIVGAIMILPIWFFLLSLMDLTIFLAQEIMKTIKDFKEEE